MLSSTLTACGSSDEAKSADEVENLILYAQWESHASLVGDAIREASKGCKPESEEADCVWYAKHSKKYDPYRLAWSVKRNWVNGKYDTTLDISPLRTYDEELHIINEYDDTLPAISFEEMTEFYDLLVNFGMRKPDSEKAIREYFFARYGGKHPIPEVDKALRELMKKIEEYKAAQKS